jgi:hypothetical protein
MRSAPSSTAWEIGVSLTPPPSIGRRLAERARGAPDAIRGADRDALGTTLRVSGDSCVDARASTGGAPDHGAYLNGWRNASAALTGATTNAISPSDRMSWTTIWVCPVSRSHSSVTMRPSPRRVSSSTNIERPHVVPTARRAFLGSGACEHFPALASHAASKDRSDAICGRWSSVRDAARRRATVGRCSVCGAETMPAVKARLSPSSGTKRTPASA